MLTCPRCGFGVPTCKAEKAEATGKRRDRMARIREQVMERAQGHCEVCATGRATECHHVLSGPLRRVRESVETCLALCMACHRDIHRGELDTLESAALYCESAGMHEATAALRRRIDKINVRRTA